MHTLGLSGRNRPAEATGKGPAPGTLPHGWMDMRTSALGAVTDIGHYEWSFYRGFIAAGYGAFRTGLST